MCSSNAAAAAAAAAFKCDSLTLPPMAEVSGLRLFPTPRDKLLFASLPCNYYPEYQTPHMQPRTNLFSNDLAFTSKAARKRYKRDESSSCHSHTAGRMHLQVEAGGEGGAHTGAVGGLGEAKPNR